MQWVDGGAKFSHGELATLSRIFDDLPISEIHRITRIPERTLYRYKEKIKSGKPIKSRQEIARKIRKLIETKDFDSESSLDSEFVFFSFLSGEVGFEGDAVRKFINQYAGSYRCYRISSKNKIIVTYLEIFWKSRCVLFQHVERVPERFKFPSESTEKVTRHRGYVFYRSPRVYLMGLSGGNIRHIIAKSYASNNFPYLFGILLTVDSKNRNPFSTRILIRKEPNYR
ncbi:MAG: hypothetical protein F6K42_36460, partial [Leptolyngbya sp. SIO1D8]|nr:hypothetical protein [Leptolyngbya sp. SIO1D8]